MKRIFILMFSIVGMILTAIPTRAEVYRSVVFNRTDGSKLALTVESGMKTQVKHGLIIMEFEQGVIKYPCSDFTGWTFSKDLGLDFEAGVSNRQEDVVEVKIGSDNILINGLAAGSRVMLAALDGSIIASLTADDVVSIPVENLTPGIYVLTYNDKSLKIALK